MIVIFRWPNGRRPGVHNRSALCEVGKISSSLLFLLSCFTVFRIVFFCRETILSATAAAADYAGAAV